jgi:Domain of unknown function (DUF1990)
MKGMNHQGPMGFSACPGTKFATPKGVRNSRTWAHEKFGFAYGTLLEDEEQGEERFTVEFHSSNQSVWYDLYAFSRPNFMARLGYPLARTLQKRFARDSKTAMPRAVADST